MKRTDGQALTVWTDPDTMKRLDAMASRLKITRSRLALNLVKAGLDDVELYERCGVLTALEAIEQAKAALVGGMPKGAMAKA